jgi:4-hydroxy-tetrahydrodipicolinate reductase
MVNIGILGASGRVGTLLIKNIQEDSNLNLSCVLAKENISNLPNGCIQTKDMKEFLNSCDGVIDFSLPQASEDLLSIALENKIYKPIVMGTTGLSPHQINLLKSASELMPICYASNMSLGVAILNEVVYMVSKRLKDFDCEIVEQHHRYKQDAPSGTALTLAHSCANARGLELDKVRVSGRDGHIGARNSDEIGVMSIRGGDVVGRHTIGFYNDGEFLELNHTATSRETFSKGALSIFKWLILQDEPMLYSIDDFLRMQ